MWTSLCEVMTDKANVEISSPKAGVVKAFHGELGDIVAVHSPLVDIDTDAKAGAASSLRQGRGRSPLLRAGTREEGAPAPVLPCTGTGSRAGSRRRCTQDQRKDPGDAGRAVLRASMASTSMRRWLRQGRTGE